MIKLKPEAFAPCIAKIAQRAGVDQKKAEAILQETAAEAERMKRSGEKDPYGVAVRNLTQEMKNKAFKDRSDAIRNMQIREGLFRDVKANGLQHAALTLESAMVNVNKRLPSMRAPLEMVDEGLRFRWASVIDAEMRKAGFRKAWDSGAMDMEVARELWKLSQARIGPHKPPESPAAKMAFIINGPLYEAGERLKGAGAKFDHAVDYITRTRHHPRQMKDAGFEKWWKDAEPLLHERTWDKLVLKKDDKGNIIETVPEAKLRFAREVYNGLITGVHGVHGDGDHMEGDVYIPPFFEGSRNIAKRNSHERVLFWKDADSWMTYMRNYGGMTSLSRTIHETLATAARHTALMERFGTNPMANLRQLIDKVEKEYRDVDPHGVIAFKRKAKHLERVMSNLDGSVNMEHSQLANDIVNGLRSFESMTKLGAVGLTHATSLPMTLWSMAPHYGVGRLEMFNNALWSIVRGAQSNADREDILAQAGAFNHGTFSHFWKTFRSEPYLPGRMSAFASITLKVTGLNYVLENVQNGWRFLLMNHLARNLELEHGKLDPLLRDNLIKYGLGEREWKMLQDLKGEMVEAEGRKYATPKDFERVSDAALDEYNKDELDKLRGDIETRREANKVADAKEAEWVKSRADALEDRIAGWRERIDKWSGQRDARIQELWVGALSKADEVKERIQEARASQKIASFLQTLETSGEVKAWTDEVRQVMENERERFRQEGVGDDETEALFNDIVNTDVDEAKARQGGSVAGGQRSAEKLAVAYGRFLARSERRIRRYFSAAEEKIKAIEGKDDADTMKFREMIRDADNAMSEFVNRSEARIWQRAERLNQLELALPQQAQRLRAKTRWQLADNYSAFLAHAGKTATVAAGARERAWAQSAVGNAPIGRLMMQFKMWPLAVMNQVHGREFYSAQSNSAKGVNFFTLLAMSVGGGLMRMSIRDVTNGNPPRDPRDPHTLMAALIQGGGGGLLGDFMFGEANRMGGGLMDTLAGPVGGDVAQLFKIYTKGRDDTINLGDGDWHHGKGPYADIWADLARATKGHIPFMNLIGLKGAMDYLMWNHIFEYISPGWWDRTNQNMLRETGRTSMFYKGPGSTPPSLFK